MVKKAPSPQGDKDKVVDKPNSCIQTHGLDMDNAVLEDSMEVEDDL